MVILRRYYSLFPFQHSKKHLPKNDHKPPVKTHVISDSEPDSPRKMHEISDSDSVELCDDDYGHISNDNLSTSLKRKRVDTSASDSDDTISNSPITHVISDSSDDGEPSSQSLLAQSKKSLSRAHTISESDSDVECINPTSRRKLSKCIPGSSKVKKKNQSWNLEASASHQEQDISNSSDSTVDLQCSDSSNLNKDSHGNDEPHGRPLCKFGSKCYRKNPSHYEEYSHPGMF